MTTPSPVIFFPTGTRLGTPNADTLSSTAPGQFLGGLAGDDVYDVLHPGTRIIEGGADGRDTVIARIDFALPDNVEDLTLDYPFRGALPNPPPSGALVGIGNDLGNMIQGNIFANRIIALGGNDTVLAGIGNDIVDGGSGDDNLSGETGNDVLIGGTGADTVSGGRGNDILIGGEGNDLLMGGGGTDIAVYAGRAAGWTIMDAGDGTVTIGGPGTEVDRASGVELAVFGMEIRLVSRFAADTARPGFDEAYYLSTHVDVQAAVQAGAIRSGWDHFVAFGNREGRAPNPLFDSAYYLGKNADVSAAVQAGQITAWDHYLQFGWRESRNPAAWFDTSAYLALNRDVADAGMNPVLHALAFGAAERRIGQVTTDFDWFV
ncbi:MAG: hypothetical protein RLY86_280 [Pseudomonadota bacterium]